MALVFPSNEDLCRIRSYTQAEKEGLSGTEYYQRAKELYEKMIHTNSRFKSYSLEEKLTDLALKWRDSSEEDRRKIDKKALAIVKRCCSVRGRFTVIAKDYYKTYRNLRQENPGFIY